MTTFIAAFVLLLAIVAMMSVGYWVKKRTMSGSCGGLAQMGIEKACDCDSPCEKRQREMKRQAFRRQQIDHL